ncbi:TrmH family RNA methyltransferase [Moheibacter sediminis]|uniref:RNA methyltransferase, TrmH family n=1 Tax=Moheibacter sediminis TaxID=1434700 RepID=A0A1W1Y6S4_9FLAO|nr:RNA methyltransferase [Moheibacter sediminis]SMC31847.1 RNA methyltransferase, TrmH family [Moheibacter sediminis]
MQIESLQNPKIKNLLKLQEKSRERKKHGLFVVEGLQEVGLAFESGFELNEIFICESIFQNQISLPKIHTNFVSEALFEKIVYRGTTGGIVGVFKMKKNELSEIKLSDNALVVVLESIEKPGNLGAILRTCDGAGVEALLVCDPLVDFYNPNVIRSSVGTIFTNQFNSDSKENIINWLRSNKIQIISTYLRDDTKTLYEIDFKGKSAIVLGTENSGLTKEWLEHSDFLVKIPMNGMVDSLNVSNAAAICIYEALRQKNYSKTE